LQKSSDTLTPLPTTKPVFLPTTTSSPLATPPVGVAATATAASASTTTATSPETTSATTAATATSTTAPSTTTSLPAATSGKWIMQIGSAPANASQAAVSAQLTKLRQVSPTATTLESGDWPKVFKGENRVIFYVGGFSSREAVIAECNRIGLKYPDKCLARQLTQ
jgi:cell division septation protein DedD